jgi:hypothetical protein
MKLGEIGQPIPVAQSRHPEADGRPDIEREAIVVRSIVIDRWLCGRPGPVEEGQQSMMKEIEETHERRIVHIPQPVSGMLGQVERKRAVRAEQAEQINVEAPRCAGCE